MDRQIKVGEALFVFIVLVVGLAVIFMAGFSAGSNYGFDQGYAKRILQEEEKHSTSPTR